MLKNSNTPTSRKQTVFKFVNQPASDYPSGTLFSACNICSKYRIPQMCSYTILGLRPIENLKARKELVIRCTKFIQRIVSWASSFIDWLKRMMCKDAFSWNMVPFTDVCNKGKAGLLLSTSQGCGIVITWIHMLDGYGTKIFVLRKPRFIPVRIMTCF